MPNYNFEYQKIKLAKAVNAETKQAISTLYQLGMKMKNLFQMTTQTTKHLKII